MMRTESRTGVIVIALLLAGGCGGGAGSSGNAAPPGERVGSTLARVTVPAPTEDALAAVRSNTALASSLYRTVAATQNGNVFLSPQSIAFALSMAYAGSGANTTDAFRSTLHVTLPELAYHRAMNDLERQLRSRGEGASGTGGQPFRLRLVNQLFAARGLPFEPPFLDLLATEYGSDVRLLDFAGAPEASRDRINEWVASATEGRIRDLLRVLERSTAAVLVNAIYFNAAWRAPFDAARTVPASFTNASGAAKEVPTMSAAITIQAANVGGIEVLELPFEGGISMLVVVPPAGALASFEQDLTPARLHEYTAALRPEHVALTLPRFEVRTSVSLKDALSALGLDVAFGEAADFGRMCAVPVRLNDVVHQAWINVNEAGAEAAAATAVIAGATGVPPSPRPVHVDRPFLFAVRDDASGAVLFLGRVTDL